MKNKTLKLTLSTLLASSSLLASDVSINSIGVNLGKAHTNYDQKNNSGTIILGNEPDTSFNSLELYLTLNPILDYCKENDIRPYISLTHSRNSDLKHQYLLVGVNKYYTPSTLPVELYAGIVGGYGQMDWKYDPLNNSSSKNADSNSFIAGIQLGASYPLNEKLSLGINSKYLVHNYETDIKTSNATTTIEQDSTATFSIGLEYSF
jgi:opacity protein-like surface antigen